MPDNPYQAAIALVQEPCEFACTGTLPSSPPFFLVYLDGMDEPLDWPLGAAQATQVQALYPSSIVPATNLRLENSHDAMLQTIKKSITEHLGPSGAFNLTLSHLVVDNVGRAATLRPTQGKSANGMFGSLAVLLPSIYEGGRITLAHGCQSAALDAATTYASFYSVTSISSAPITAGRRVVLVYRLVYTGTHDKMRRAPVNQAAAIAAFTALAGSPFDGYELFTWPIAYSHEENDVLCFDRLQPFYKGLVNVLLATKCFEVALVTRYEDTGLSAVVLHRACEVPEEVMGACEHCARNAFCVELCGGDPPPPHMLVFWPKHLRVYMIDRAETLAYLAAALLGDASSVQSGYLGVASVDDILHATMATFRSGSGCACSDGRQLERTGTPLGTLSRLLAQQPDLELTLRFIADMVSIENDVRLPEVARWLHGLLTTHGWGRFQSALLKLLDRWATNCVADVLHFLASLAGLADEPLCPPLRQKHDAELLKRCWVSLHAAPFAVSQVHRRAASVTHYLLLDAYLTNTAPGLAHANYMGHWMPPTLVSIVDAFLLPTVVRWIGSGRYCNTCAVAVGVAAAIQQDLTIARHPLVAQLLDAFRNPLMNFPIVRHSDEVGWNAAQSILFLALDAKRLDDIIFNHVADVWGLAVLPAARLVAIKHKDILGDGFASRVVTFVLKVVNELALEPTHHSGRGSNVDMPKPEAALVLDAIVLLRLFAPDQLPSFVDTWLQRLPETAEVTDAMVLPLARLVVDDAPLCRKLLNAAVARPHVGCSSLYASEPGDGLHPRTSTEEMRLAKEDVADKMIAAAIADVQTQLASYDDDASSALPPKRLRHS